MAEDRMTRRVVTVVMALIAALAFVFSFGNVWSLALRLGVPRPVAPLIAPMVDLSVLGLLVALRHLSLHGVPAAQLRGALRLMHLSGLLTLALNVAEPIITGHYGRAALDAVAPVLLLGWAQVGPQLLRSFRDISSPAPVPAPPVAPLAAAAPAPSSTAVPGPLLEAARRIADNHRAEHGEPIAPAQLRARLGVSMPLAAAAHAQLSA
ncbi:DUF2637 domain-containing protein [Streptomyces sp. NBC_01803]|uniref:DUF2637 domain-containing protein n=1 Tax=Streptomyces sp. NBC_01803 TaxID=2975946 RepID=UPI002DD86851|nr:DUF2637 domain-containing protein [Streptomyces sp. NBC_01803]WSA45102.1 DUF2637 domain-containing protein [Streptomyces sp. NBC_01803]